MNAPFHPPAKRGRKVTPHHSWPAGDVNRVTTLWNDGNSAGTIARIMGMGLTRNAIIGKVHRLKLHRRFPGTPRATRARASIAPAVRVDAKRKQGGQPGALNQRKVARLLKQGPGHQTPPRAELYTGPAWEPLPGTTPLPFELADGCRWPIYEPVTHVCGQSVREGSSYCRDHNARSVA